MLAIALANGGRSCGTLANRRCSASAALNRFAHRGEQTRYSSAVTLNDCRKLSALGERHTHTVDANVLDLVAPVVYREPPINFNRQSLWPNDLAGHQYASGIGPATVHSEALAAILRKPLTIKAHKMVFEGSKTLAAPPWSQLANTDPEQSGIYR
jgi:hypothetical protein